MQLDFDGAKLGELQVLAIELPARAIGIGETRIAMAPLKAGIARIAEEEAQLLQLHLAKEVLEGFLKPMQHILQKERALTPCLKRRGLRARYAHETS